MSRSDQSCLIQSDSRARCQHVHHVRTNGGTHEGASHADITEQRTAHRTGPTRPTTQPDDRRRRHRGRPLGDRHVGHHARRRADDHDARVAQHHRRFKWRIRQLELWSRQPRLDEVILALHRQHQRLHVRLDHAPLEPAGHDHHLHERVRWRHHQRQAGVHPRADRLLVDEPAGQFDRRRQPHGRRG